jgi:hypothetical protein
MDLGRDDVKKESSLLKKEDNTIINELPQEYKTLDEILEVFKEESQEQFLPLFPSKIENATRKIFFPLPIFLFSPSPFRLCLRVWRRGEGRTLEGGKYREN